MAIFSKLYFFFIFLLLPNLNLLAQFKCLDTIKVVADLNQASYNKEGNEKALKDLSEGNIYYYQYGYISKTTGTEKLEKQIDSLTKAYGFEYKLGGCIIPWWIESYHKVVKNYLDKRNGQGWKEKFDKEVKKLENAFYNSKP